MRPPRPPIPPIPGPMPLAVPGLPVGSVVSFAGAVVPFPGDTGGDPPEHATLLWRQGWLVCDGRELKVSEYPELFAAIGYLYSKTSSGDTFLLPDLRGYFLRGVDSGSGKDPDAGTRKLTNGDTAPGVGSLQDCALQLHEHDYTKPVASPAGAGPTAEAASLVETVTAPTDSVVQEPGSQQPLFTSPAETRPMNIAMYFIIRFTNFVRV
ncbi:phage tail protein [Archangium lipolyticum]|uniref:phage tail protein n=1 Tax=Archangium lipolyticum TaxID=2970465 RepID=UPI002149BCCB|nr:phage tail protein [Archangium lipolyticum]